MGLWLGPEMGPVLAHRVLRPGLHPVHAGLGPEPSQGPDLVHTGPGLEPRPRPGFGLNPVHPGLEPAQGKGQDWGLIEHDRGEAKAASPV